MQENEIVFIIKIMTGKMSSDGLFRPSVSQLVGRTKPQTIVLLPALLSEPETG